MFLRFHLPLPRNFEPLESTMRNIAHRYFFASSLQYQYAFVFDKASSMNIAVSGSNQMEMLPRLISLRNIVLI